MYILPGSVGMVPGACMAVTGGHGAHIARVLVVQCPGLRVRLLVTSSTYPSLPVVGTIRVPTCVVASIMMLL